MDAAGSRNQNNLVLLICGFTTGGGLHLTAGGIKHEEYWKQCHLKQPGKQHSVS
jgi:hypothetical protein